MKAATKIRLIKAALRRYKQIKIIEFKTICVQNNLLDVLYIQVKGRTIIIGKGEER